MASTNAERQRRYRERRKTEHPRVHYRRPQQRSSRPQRWQDAVRTLLDLQGEYQGWFDNLAPISRSPRPHTSWRQFVRLILANWRASSRRAGSGATDEPAAPRYAS